VRLRANPAQQHIGRGASMSLVSFGQPDDGIIQMSYVVSDIVAQWTRGSRSSSGRGSCSNFTGVDPQYRGKPSQADVSLAMSFAGHDIELIQPNNDAPSVYREVPTREARVFITGVSRRRISIVTSSAIAPRATISHFPARAQRRPCCVHGHLVVVGGFVELIELGGEFEAVFNRFYRAAIGWDGQDPIRSFI
jgi:hypothetical protein